MPIISMFFGIRIYLEDSGQHKVMHDEELRANCELLKDNQAPFRIDPLK